MSEKNTYASSADETSTERIPTYEESVASSTNPRSMGRWEKSSRSMPSMIRQERTRRIEQLIAELIVPTVSMKLSSGCSSLSIIILPSASLTANGEVTEQNIVTPGPQAQESRTVLTLRGEENSASFWTQNPVVQELEFFLRQELSEEPIDAATLFDNQLQAEVRSQPTAPLPQRPKPKSWLKRAFESPGADHDPTGETGKWNLGWRSPDTRSGSQDSGWRAKERRRNVQRDELAVHARLENVSFRTESEMGLLETNTVKCLWVEIELGL
ncbi:hypothetical protein, variant [Exophiala oligosperma]|uniref:Uncharacterized protein n=1 Tax=Exophiala oligosperma TaxID=215243 RepID=A0A0D2E254_9EURO|nr:uncharacterized protein PV06_05488 [Exophiala oligosperma]XP_016262105.1 hypothetical protein, variant [Exophiala oligosperma]KIW41888.1 hypothetical protein PV06_05488 [Exophiala oligosperma]KIW41889.1 hypothetical protein, variant [Exophiala oligosperma]